MGKLASIGRKATELGELPKGWEIRRLSELAQQLQYGLTASAAATQVGPRFLRITDIQEGSVNWSAVPSCNCSVADLDKFRLHRGDLVVARIGATTGKAYLLTEAPEAVFASYLIRIRVAECLLSEFLDQFTKSEFYWKQINEKKGGRLKQGVNIPNLQSLMVPVPPLPEQRAIAHILKAVQQAKEAAENVITAAKQLKQSLMRHLFTYGPVPFYKADQVELRDNNAGTSPSHWELKKLGTIARLKTGGTPSRKNPSYWNGGIPWVKTGEIIYDWIRSTEETISREGLENSNAQVFPEDTLLIAMYGQGVTRGRVARLGITAATNQACAAIFPRDGAETQFLYSLLTYNYERVREMGHGANQRNLSLTLLNALEINIPPLPEQQAIGELLEPIDLKLAAEKLKLRSLQKTFDSLLHNLMSGKIRVQNLNLPEILEASQKCP